VPLRDAGAAFIETLLRNPRIPFVERTEIEIRSASALANDHVLKLVDFRGGGLSQIGADNRLTTGSYAVAGQWALALWQHADAPDGILYRSKHDPKHICTAIFDRAHCRFSVSSSPVAHGHPTSVGADPERAPQGHRVDPARVKSHRGWIR